MGKTRVPPRLLVDRLERKFQRKTRFQKYKNLAKNLQQLSKLRGVRVKDLKDNEYLAETYNFKEYEYTSR